MTQKENQALERGLASNSDVAAALGNPGELMRHVGMWIKHSAPMVGSVMEAIAQGAPEEFIKNIDSLVGVLPDRDIKAWLQLAIHALVQKGQHRAILRHAGVPREHFGNGATAVIMSIAARNLPPQDVFDARVLRNMKGWGFIDSEVCLVLQEAISAATAKDWNRQRVLVDDILGVGSFDRVFSAAGRAGPTAAPTKTGKQVVHDVERMVTHDPKGALDRMVVHCAVLETEDVVRLLVQLGPRLPLEEIFDSRLLRVVQDKKVSDQEVLAILSDALNAVPMDNPLPLKDILFFSPAWTPFLSARVVADVLRLLKTKVPQEVIWFKEHLASSLNAQDRREVFGADDDDSHLERAYANSESVRPVREKIIASSIKALTGLGKVGRQLADRLRALAKDSTPTSKDNRKIIGSRINAVAGLEHSHVGGMGISIQWDRDRKELQRALVHEVVAGNIFGDPQEVHYLADVVAHAAVDGSAKDRAEAERKLNALAAQSLRLSPLALWEMTQAERDRRRDERDFASHHLENA